MVVSVIGFCDLQTAKWSSLECFLALPRKKVVSSHSEKECVFSILYDMKSKCDPSELHPALEGKWRKCSH
jgi:hypothetical protein